MAGELRGYGAQHLGTRLLADYETLDKQGNGALPRPEAAPGVPAGRLKADPREKEIARLGAENTELRRDLGKARTVIEVREDFLRCWINSLRAATGRRA